MKGQRYPTADEYDPDYSTYQDDDAPEPSEMVEQMGLSEGTDWTGLPDGPVMRVLMGERLGDVVVTDPTETNPQAARAGNWGHHVTEMYESWRQGSLVPANASEGFDPAPPGEDAAPELVEEVAARGPTVTVSFGEAEEGMQVTLVDSDGDTVDEVTLSETEASGVRANGGTVTVGGK